LNDSIQPANGGVKTKDKGASSAEEEATSFASHRR
jgi:hypothetical protein